MDSTSTAQWPQGIGLVKPIVMDHHNQDQEIRNGNACNRAMNGGERRATRPQEQLNCPRCNSTNTKFCYYNNYSLTQPRYFCKGCRRYWTEGGSLRNVPVGGGSRKNKRSSSSTYKLPDLNPHDQNPNNKQSQAGHDLNLSFQGSFMQLPKMENHQNETNNNPCSNSSSSSALDLLRTGIATSFIDSNTTLYSSSSAPAGGFSLQSTHHQLMSFPVMDALASNGNNTGRLFFPFGDFNKQVTAPVAAGPDHQDNKGNNNNNANRYWNGMLQGGGGGSSW